MSLEAIEQNVRSILEIIDSRSGTSESKRDNILKRAANIRKLIREELNEMKVENGKR